MCSNQNIITNSEYSQDVCDKAIVNELKPYTKIKDIQFDVTPLEDLIEVKRKESIESPVDWLADARNISERIQRNSDRDITTLTAESFTHIPDKHAKTYELERFRKNAMIIFNHHDFLSPDLLSRPGSVKDEESLKKTFSKFGFEVENTHHDKTKKELFLEMDKFCKRDFREYGCVCVVVMTHGTGRGYMMAMDTDYHETELFDRLSIEKNGTLFHKPIIFLIQACRGTHPAKAYKHVGYMEKDIQFDGINKALIHYELPTECDRIIYHSSSDERASAIHISEGSWFIQTICQQIDLLASTEHILSIFQAVQRHIAINKRCTYSPSCGKHNYIAKQMPSLHTTLIRDLYLRRYGDIYSDTDAQQQPLIESTGLISPYTCECACYFEYMKDCLRSYINENPYDDEAISALKLAEHLKSNDNNNVRKTTKLIMLHLKNNAEQFSKYRMVFNAHCCYSDATKDNCRQNFLSKILNIPTSASICVLLGVVFYVVWTRLKN